MAGGVNINERYTLEVDLRGGARFAGLNYNAADPLSIFDLDAAACTESHWARHYYTKETDGLLLPWWGNVFVNPPFDMLWEWVQRAWRAANEPLVNSVLMLIPGDRTEQPFWQEMVEPFRDHNDNGAAPWRLRTKFLKGRTRFGHPGNPLAVDVGSPPFKCVYLRFQRGSVNWV